MDGYLVVDLEMCMVRGGAKKRSRGMLCETIQIGAVILNQENHIVDDFSVYVKPEYGKLNRFIKDLTGITEENLDKAPPLRTALMKLANWLGERKVIATSWSNADYIQLAQETRVKKIKDHRINKLLDSSER
ncbi:3'-5' exonuclease [Ohessyouella blattaphilus]|uniref:Exonuclease domain-containing protein n=1 Tax=Ohessyouella blattaphilus TaxID=2949333 RepID=A0ABT1EL30_9FIRM|nr:3'-5' exonuclease [Ohessyouella blattaphilus]MCP1110487.1 exonuclease domain-containing protein [Ohessyouella blattaphilus]MCR8563881.1 exonuclease domain-containing protein [Ohessyouella blattaphilus]